MLWKWYILNMPANLENSAMATGLEKVSFHSNPTERQCQRMFKLPHNCTHFTCLQCGRTQVRCLGREDPLEKEMATHSSTLAWKIPWTEEPGRLQSMGLQRVGHDWATSLHTSHTSKIMFKILQARLQQFVKRELPDVQAGFRKGRGTRDQIANICWIIEKARQFQKNIYFCSWVSVVACYRVGGTECSSA